MKNPVLLLLASVLSVSSVTAEEGFTPLFNGSSLENWDGNAKFWSVQDGAITGQTTAKNPTQGNTFLIYRQPVPSDFELRAEYRIVGGNSGIQYRSFETAEKWVVGGYQGDIDSTDVWSGTNYGERFRGILAKRGERTVIDAEGKPVVIGMLGDPRDLQKQIKNEDWNSYRIVARDNRFKHWINDVLMSAVTDEDGSSRRFDGLIALQLHAGPPMKVQFRNIRISSGSSEATAAAAPPLAPANTKNSREAKDAVAQLEVAAGLEATLFASEPMILSPSNIDIDHRGRVWVAEIVNYRGHNGKRPEGDRILILEDTNGDGQADSSKTFYQKPDFVSPHGICVLGNKVIVSMNMEILVLTDENGDDQPDKVERMFQGEGSKQHDHTLHAFVFGPDGKLYFNHGNEVKRLKDKNGQPVIDRDGVEVAQHRKPYQEGMIFRCDMDGANLETIAWNFRNNWEVAVDSFGTVWQSDNDDDGNKGVRINYVMEFGNYGRNEEMTGAGWQQKRTNQEAEIPLRHWHLNDPGVVPNLLQTGAGSPTGITVYEGDLLPAAFHGQMIHCDPGPNVCRAYPVTNDGAGYKAEMLNILAGARDNWFRPVDPCVAPDGSLLVADWYDPGVGGHTMGDLQRGRIFRVAPPGKKYEMAKLDFSTAEGAVAALKSPNQATRYLAWTTLHKMGHDAEGALEKLWQSDNPRYRARALWLLGKIPDHAEGFVGAAIKDADPNIRITGLRLARQSKMDWLATVGQLVNDPSPQVRRECAIALRHHNDKRAADLWVALASQHDGKDRWYLEALGIGADKQWDAFLGAWLAKNPDGWKTPAGRDLIWRSRGESALEYLVKVIKEGGITAAEQPRYIRAFDFHQGPKKDAALLKLLE